MILLACGHTPKFQDRPHEAEMDTCADCVNIAFYPDRKSELRLAARDRTTRDMEPYFYRR